MFILASASPRRKNLLSMLVSDFKVIPSNVDESKIIAEPYDLPLELSKLKANDVYKDHQDDTILACDTIVILDNEVIGKPKDENDAIKMLLKLSGRKHIVVTGYTFISKDKIIHRSVKSEVYFNDLDLEYIKKYVKEEKPLDKAGAYGVQDKKYKLVKKITGSYYNVMGLPVEDIKKYCF